MAYIGSIWEKSDLVSRKNLARWFMPSAHDSGASIVDSAGLGAPLVPIDGAHAPTIGSPLNGQNGIVFNGTTARGLVSNDIVPLVKYALIIAAYNPATFAGYSGLLSDRTATAILVGGGTGNPNFVDIGYGNGYTRNRLAYSMSAAPGPVGGVPAVLEWIFPSGAYLDGLQAGEDRAFGIARIWNGPIYEILLYSEIPNSQELLNLARYTAMRYQLWDDYNSAGLKIFPFPSDFGAPISESKSVLTSRSISGTVKQRYKTAVPKQALEVVWDNRRAAELAAARAFHKQFYGSSSFIFRDYTNDPATDIEAYIMSEIQYRKGMYQKAGYSFAIAEK